MCLHSEIGDVILWAFQYGTFCDPGTFKIKGMSATKLGAPILKILNKKYPPSTLIEQRFGRYDLAFKTDEEGRPVLLFLGKMQENGKIRGERFSRTLIKDEKGIVKDHWDNKGRVS